MEPRARIHFLLCAMMLTTVTVVGLREAIAAEEIRVHTVTIEGMKFSPAVLRIHLGERVIFENKDILPHTATAKDPKVFDSGLIEAGGSWTVQPAQTIQYVCLFHPTMEGQLIVERP